MEATTTKPSVKNGLESGAAFSAEKKPYQEGISAKGTTTYSYRKICLTLISTGGTKKNGMDTNREFDICWLKGNSYAEVTAPNRTSLKNRIMKMSAKGEPGVKVMVINPDGSIVAHVPVEFIKVNKPRKVNASNGEKGRKALEEYRMRKAAEEAETVDDLPFSDLDEDEDEDLEDEEDRDEFN